MRRIILTLLMAAGVLSASTIFAQTYDISWHTIAGGGGFSCSAGGSYSVTGTTIGQPAARANLSGGAYFDRRILGHHFGRCKSPARRSCTITAGTGNHAVISWSSAATGFTLQQDPSLGNTNWANVNTTTFPIVVTNGLNTVTVTVSGNQYFRLVSH